jgi:hypothetical protein
VLLGTANVMEGVVNWTILIGNRGAAHGSLQAAQPAIRRIVACSPQHQIMGHIFCLIHKSARPTCGLEMHSAYSSGPGFFL